MRAAATARRTLKRHWPPTLISHTPSLEFYYNSTTHSFPSKLKMATEVLSSSPIYEVGRNWHTPKRARVRQAREDGKSWGWIERELRVPRSTARGICKAPTSRRTRKWKQYQKKLLNRRDLRRIIRFISQNYTTRRLSFQRVRALLGIEASARTIRRELRKIGYRRCIACSRPFISRKQAKKRFGFAF